LHLDVPARLASRPRRIFRREGKAMASVIRETAAGATGRKVVTFPLIDLKGSPREIGRQLGEERRASVRAMLAEVKSNLIDARVPFGTGLSAGELLDEVRRYIPQLEKLAPSVADELRGIAEGAGFSLEEAYFMQIPFAGCGLLLGSRRWREPTNALDDYFAGTTGGCTTFGVTREAAQGGKVYLGQTCDFYPNYKQYWSIRRITPAQGPQILAGAPDGILTWGNGLNAAGLGVEYNLLGYPDAKIGLTPFALGRMMLNQETIAAAVAVAQSPDRSSAWNWMVADATGTAYDIETTATQATIIGPEQGLLTHANCYMSSEFAVEDLSVQLLPDSHLRANRLRQLLARRAGNIDVAYIKACYEDHLNFPKAICRHPVPDAPMIENLDSNILIISDLQERTLYACPGPVCEHELVRYSLH
jgi:isopenicillin-N N-acyltransferase-like protein